jgi:hypothetical protein
LESVETSNPGGIKITSSHFDVEFSCKIILLLVYIFKILHRRKKKLSPKKEGITT